MKLQSTIKQIIIESSVNDALRKSIDSQGLYTTMRLTGLSFAQITAKIGLEWITEKIMLDFIHEVMGKVLPSFGLGEVEEPNIYYNHVGPELREIVFLGSTKVIVEVINEITLNIEGEFRVPYYNLSDDILKQIFDVVIRVLDENIEI